MTGPINVIARREENAVCPACREAVKLDVDAVVRCDACQALRHESCPCACSGVVNWTNEHDPVLRFAGRGSDVYQTTEDAPEYARPLSGEVLPLPTEGARWLMVPHTGDGYGADTVCRSNMRAFQSEHSDAIDCNACGVVEARGSIYIRLGSFCEEHRQSLADTLAGLENYPLIDDEDHSKLEMEEQEESWDSYARRDIQTNIAGYCGLDSRALDDLPHGAFDGWYYEWCSDVSRYPEGSDDNVTFPDPTERSPWGPKDRPDDRIPPGEMLMQMMDLGPVDFAGATVIIDDNGARVVEPRGKNRHGRGKRNATRAGLLRQMRHPMWADRAQRAALKRLPRTRKGMRQMLRHARAQARSLAVREACASYMPATRKER